MNWQEDDQAFRFTTPLGPNALLVRSLEGEERVSAPFRFTLRLVSEEPWLPADKLLGKPATILIARTPLGDSPRAPRVIHGRVSRFARTGFGDGSQVWYEAELVPWLALLAHSTDSRVFYDKSAIDIVKEVCAKAGYSDLRVACSGTCPVRTHCVQFNETDLAFVSRLLEEEGIFYFFEHTADVDRLVLADAPNAVTVAWGEQKLEMVGALGTSERAEGPYAYGLRHEFALHSGEVTVVGHDFTNAAPRLQSVVAGGSDETITGAVAAAARVGRRYEWDGFATPADGDPKARLLIEGEEAQRQVVRGSSGSAGLQSGAKVKLSSLGSDETAGEYTVLVVRHAGTNGGLTTGEAYAYSNEFVAVPHEAKYRPPLVTPRPRVPGAQTAVVTYTQQNTDEFGRVGLRFQWQREGEPIARGVSARVASAWAGAGYGFIQMPRVDQEVVVEFLDGDPDRPIVVGRLYNAANMPPYALPGNHTQSGIHTQSDGGASDAFNELRFEDKNGDEHVRLQAQKNLMVLVKNDETREVLHDRTTTITNDDTRTVAEGNDTTEITKGNRTLTVKTGNESITVSQGDRSIDVSQGKHETKLASGAYTVTTSSGMQSFDSPSSGLELKSGPSKIEITPSGIKLTVGPNSVEISASAIALKCGPSTFELSPAAAKMKSLTIGIEGSVQTEVKGLMTTVEGSAMTTVKGGITMIN